jgi:hypothetical protein
MQKPVSGFCTKGARKNGLIESQLFALRAAASYCWQLQQLHKKEKCEKVH